MKFPVDLLADVRQVELERLAHRYMDNLLYSNPDCPEHLTLSDSTQVTIDISSVGFVPLYGSGDKHKILALFSPSDPFTAVALYLLDRWWVVDDILKTADPTRGGAVEVETVGERIVLYILNRVVYRAKEMSPEELPFLCHGEKDNAKILWNDGEAVGFYSVKPAGSFCSAFSTRSYQLPVMDSIFVRKCQRGKGFGLQMLEDFVLSFKEDCLGLRYPVTKFMYKVCEKYLCQYPGDTDLLWEVESIGGPKQRTNIARKIQAMDQSAVSRSLTFTEESLMITERTEKDVVMEAIATQIKETGSMECTVEIVEEVTMLSVTKVSESEVALTARGRSSGSKRRKMGEKIGEDKSEKVIRIEDIEAESPSKDQVSAQQKTELQFSELVKTESMSSVAPEGQGEDMVDTEPGDAAEMLDRPDTVLAQQDLEDASSPTTEEPQVEDDAPQNLNNISCDSQITVENVASEIEEECQEEVSEEASEEAETLDKVGEGTQVGVTDEKSEERVTQQENGEAGKTGRAIVKAVTTVQSITPRRSSTRHSKQEEGAKDGGIMLRGRTLRNTPPPTRRYTRRSQKVSEESDKEVDEVEEEKGVSTTEVVEESALTEGEEEEEEEEEEETAIEEDVVAVEELLEETQQLEDEQLKNEEKTEKQQEPGVEDTELPDTAETALAKEHEDETDESESGQNGEEVETSVIQNKADVPENEIEELPAEASAGEEKADEQASYKQVEEHHQVANDAVTVTVTMEEKQCAVSEICADREADTPVGDDAEGNLPLAEVDEALSLEEEEAPVVEPRALRRKTKTSTATPRRKSTRGRKQVDAQEAENSEEEEEEEEEPAVTTRTLRRGRISTTDTPKGKSRRSRKQIQEETQKGEEESQCVEERGGVEEDAAKEAAVEKTDEEMEEIVDKVKETTSEKEEGLELKIDDVEGQEAVSEQKPDTVEVITGLGSDPPTEGGEGKAPEEELVTAEVEKGESEEGTMTLTEEEEDTETDAPLASPPTDSAVLPPVEEEATPSAEEQQSEDLATQLSDRRRVTVVLVDLQKPHHDVQEEAAATEEGLPVRKTAAEAEEEQREETMKEEETVAQETVPGSEEEGCGDKVEAATIQDPGEGRDEETAKEEEAKSVHVGEQKPIVTETRTPKSGKQAVEGTPRTRGRPRKGQGRKKAASKIQKEEPAVQVRVLRTGRKSFPVAQSSPTKRTRKQFQEEEEEEEEEEGGEESTAIEAIEGEQQMTDQEKEESLEDRDATEQVENLEAETPLEKEDTVAEEIEVENEDLVPAEVEKGESEEGTMTLSEDEEDTETDAPLASPPTDSAVLPPVEEEATPSAEEQQSEDLATQLSDRRRVTVVLVDLQKPHHDVQEEAAATEEGLPVRKTAAEAEEEQREETMKEEETVAQETVPGSPLGIEKTKLEKVIVEAVTKEDTEEGSDEETAKAVKATRTRGRPRKVRKEAASKIQIEENLEAETALEKQDTVAEEAVNQHGAQEEGQVDSTGTVADEETEASVEQRDDGVKTLVVAEEAVAKLDTVEGEQSTSTSEVVESKHQDTMLTAKDEQEKDASEEEAPVVEQVLRSGKKTVRATARSKTPKRHDDEEEEEEEAPGEKSTEEDEPAVEIRILRKGRKSADPAPRRKSKRARTQCQTEEEEEEETTPPEETQVEETKAVLEETDKKEESRDEDAPQDEGNTEPELCIVAEAVSGESVTEQEAVEENESAAKRQEEEQEEGSEDDEPAVETRVLRKGRRSAAAAPRRKSKRARTQCQQEDEGDEEATPAEEIEGEEEEAGQESPEEKGMEVEEMEKEEEFAVGDAEQTRDASTAEAGVLEEEDNRVDGTGSNAVLPSSGEVEETNSAVEEETAVVEQPSAAAEVGSDAAVSDEEALAEEAPAVAEEDAPAATTRAFRSKQKASPTAPSPRSRRKKDDSPRRSVRKRPKVDYRENEEGERDETEGNTDEERAVPVAAHEEQGNKESECSSNADEVGEAAGSSQEDEEYEQNASEEEEEPIVIGTRVLRGRSVPSVIITPQSKSRRRSANVSNQEGSPRSARKRRSTEVTRKSQRLSRV